MPKGFGDVKEARLERHGLGVLDVQLRADLRGFWLKHPRRANTPNWDLAASCTVAGRRGLVLVEAKAHVDELSASGKLLVGAKVHGKRQPPSANAKENHDHIIRQVKATCEVLRPLLPGVAIDAQTHYQHANRITFAAWLAQHGIPVVLMYLGFTGDKDVKGPDAVITDAAHWNSVVRDHIAGVYPISGIESVVPCGPASFTLLIRSMPGFSYAPLASVPNGGPEGNAGHRRVR